MSLKQTLKQAKHIERELQQRKQVKAKDSALKKSSMQLKQRNPVATSPLLTKGGVHKEDDVKAVHKNTRRQTKQKLRKQDWLSDL